jgi:hypothetical protein
MSEKRIGQIERRILRIKQELQKIGPLRPGSLTKQYKDPEKKTGPFWQLSYTRAMRSRTDYIRKNEVKEIRKQIAAYKRLKSLTAEWVDLSIELSKLTLKLDRK